MIEKHYKSILIFLLMSIIGNSLFSCASSKQSETGKASFYHNKYRGRETANGEKFRQYKRTAAHKTLPFGTKVKVINLNNGKKVRVRINDRGPFVEGRNIDLSRRAARKIDMLDYGVVPVKLKYRIK